MLWVKAHIKGLTIYIIWAATLENLSSGVSDIARLKPVSSATETSYKIEIWLVSSLDMILYNKRITKALIRLRIWEDSFSRGEVHLLTLKPH